MDQAQVELTRVIEKMNLNNRTPDVPVDDIVVTVPDINRPALQLTGNFDNFKGDRIQILGDMECALIEKMPEEDKDRVFEQLLAEPIPAVIFSRDRKPDPLFLKWANEYKVPVFSSPSSTAALTAEIIRWLNVRLAPCTSIHGVLVDCYGVGVLLIGESGIGKSEAALELIVRGHRLVTDDIVEIHKVSEVTLVGTAPEVTKHFIELRGIGVLDIKTMFGVQSVIETSGIDLVIKLKEWNQDEDYDRIGLNEDTIEILGNQVTCHTIPIRPGRNLAVIVEAAAVNYRQKKMGYNATDELYKRVEQGIQKRSEE